MGLLLSKSDYMHVLVFSNYSTQVSTQVSNAFDKPHFLMSDFLSLARVIMTEPYAGRKFSYLISWKAMLSWQLPGNADFYLKKKTVISTWIWTRQSLEMLTFTVTGWRLHAELPSTDTMSLEAMPISFCVKGLWLTAHSWHLPTKMMMHYHTTRTTIKIVWVVFFPHAWQSDGHMPGCPGLVGRFAANSLWRELDTLSNR